MSGQSWGSNPHDALFRRILADPTNAASQLRASLPDALACRLDLTQLTQVPGSFIDSDLRWRHSDLLFTVPLDGTDAFVYVLAEHQSTCDALMAFRMLRYVVRIWDRFLAENSRATRLPGVIPLVVHHNRRPWNSPVDVLDIVDLPPDAIDVSRSFLPRFKFILDDLANTDELTLRARPLTPETGLMLWLLKISTGNSRLVDDLRSWAPELNAVLQRPHGIEDFIAFVKYIETVGETPADQLQGLFTELGPAAEEAYMTTAEQLRDEGRVEGRNEGRAEGRNEGRAEGRNEGRADALLQLLQIRFGAQSAVVTDRVRAASADVIAEWTARVLTANTVDDVLH